MRQTLIFNALCAFATVQGRSLVARSREDHLDVLRKRDLFDSPDEVYTVWVTDYKSCGCPTSTAAQPTSTALPYNIVQVNGDSPIQDSPEFGAVAVTTTELPSTTEIDSVQATAGVLDGAEPTTTSYTTTQVTSTSTRVVHAPTSGAQTLSSSPAEASGIDHGLTTAITRTIRVTQYPKTVTDTVTSTPHATGTLASTPLSAASTTSTAQGNAVAAVELTIGGSSTVAVGQVNALSSAISPNTIAAGSSIVTSSTPLPTKDSTFGSAAVAPVLTSSSILLEVLASSSPSTVIYPAVSTTLSSSAQHSSSVANSGGAIVAAQGNSPASTLATTSPIPTSSSAKVLSSSPSSLSTSLAPPDVSSVPVIPATRSSSSSVASAITTSSQLSSATTTSSSASITLPSLPVAPYLNSTMTRSASSGSNSAATPNVLLVDALQQAVPSSTGLSYATAAASASNVVSSGMTPEQTTSITASDPAATVVESASPTTIMTQTRPSPTSTTTHITTVTQY